MLPLFRLYNLQEVRPMSVSPPAGHRHYPPHHLGHEGLHAGTLRHQSKARSAAAISITGFKPGLVNARMHLLVFAIWTHTGHARDKSFLFFIARVIKMGIYLRSCLRTRTLIVTFCGIDDITFVSAAGHHLSRLLVCNLLRRLLLVSDVQRDEEKGNSSASRRCQERVTALVTTGLPCPDYVE